MATELQETSSVVYLRTRNGSCCSVYRSLRYGPDSREEETEPEMRRRLTVLAIFSTIILSMFGAFVARRVVSRQMATQPWPPPPMDFRAARTTYPLSVVPGGVYDWKEVSDSVKHDPVVRQHYENIHVNNLWAGRTMRPSLVYVSYRKGNEIFWTRNKVVIPKGELVLTDGDNVIRARCGNRLRKLPPPLGSSTNPGDDPPDMVLETPIPSIVQPPADLQAVLIARTQPVPLPPVGQPPVQSPQTPPGPPVPPTTEPGPPIVPIIPVIPPISPPSGPPTGPSQPPVVPEPGTLLLFLSGTGLLAGATWRRCIR